jgi:hypothetical protein
VCPGVRFDTSKLGVTLSYIGLSAGASASVGFELDGGVTGIQHALRQVSRSR